MKVNEKIRLLREQNNWSQEEMANRLNMSVTGYAKIERGESNSNLPRLEQISQIFGLDLWEFFAYGEEGKIVLQHSDNNFHYSCISLGNNNADLAQEIQRLQLMLAHKDEIIAMQKKELHLFEQLVDSLKGNK